MQGLGVGSKVQGAGCRVGGGSVEGRWREAHLLGADERAQLVAVVLAHIHRVQLCMACVRVRVCVCVCVCACA